MSKERAPASSAAKQRKTTWLDWMPDGTPMPPAEDLFTREQVAETLGRLRTQVTPEDLRYWERKEIIPRGVRRWHDGAIRSVYPGWYINLVFHLRKLQHNGLTLDQIRRRIGAHGRLVAGPTTDAIDTDLKEILAAAIPPSPGKHDPDDPESTYWEPTTGAGAIPLDAEMGQALQRHAVRYERFTGVPIVRVFVTMVDGEGEEMIYAFPISIPATDRPHAASAV